MKRLTRAGAACLVAAAVASAAALLLASWALSLVGTSLLIAIALAWLAPAATGVRAQRDVASATLTEGMRTRVRLQVRGPRRTHARVVERPHPALRPVNGETTRRARLPILLEYEAVAATPGRWSAAELEVTFTDPLGLVEERLAPHAHADVTIYPRIEPLRELPLSSRVSLPLGGPHATGQAGPGSDFYALRGYQEGDTMRDVNWRASARTGKGLVVNQREKESQSVVTFFVDVRAVAGVGTLTRNSRVDALRAFASLAAHAARRRDRPRLVVYGAEVLGPIAARAGDAALSSLIEPLLAAPTAGARTLMDAVHHALPTLRPKAPVVIVSSMLRDPRAPAAVTALRALDQDVTLVAIDVDAHLEASGAAPEVIASEKHARDGTIEQMRANGARVVGWKGDEPLALALAREALA